MARSPLVTLTAFAWGAAEATVFFVVPDVLLGYVALVSPRRAPAATLAAIGGALAGGAGVHRLSAHHERAMRSLIAAMPGVRESDFDLVRGQLVADGPAVIFRRAWTGQPMKLYVHQASVLGMPVSRLALPLVANRIVRLGGGALGYALAGTILRRPIARHPRLTGAAYLAAWSLGYAAYWLGRRDPGEPTSVATIG